ncbi:MAG: hypothetical protein K0S45_3435 [Nitrospira sp.]|nr:hypothetical protein [Nitrospira sp.]
MAFLISFQSDARVPSMPKESISAYRRKLLRHRFRALMIILSSYAVFIPIVLADPGLELNGTLTQIFTSVMGLMTTYGIRYFLLSPFMVRPSPHRFAHFGVQNSIAWPNRTTWLLLNTKSTSDVCRHNVRVQGNCDCNRMCGAIYWHLSVY